MTELIYYSEPERSSFSAKILEIREDKRGVSLILDRTCFYPEGGGQPADKGRIAELNIIDVQKTDDEVLHYFEEGKNRTDLPAEGSTAECEVDMDHRFDYMQQHTGQHLVSAALVKIADIQTVSVHQGEEYTAIETSAEEIDALTIAGVESEVNRIICLNLPVNAVVTDDEGLSEFNLRRPTKRSGKIRIVEIPGTDCVACGGLHLSSTGLTGLAKCTGTEKIRGHVRLLWKIGRRAYEDYSLKTAVTDELSVLYSAPLAEITDRCKDSLEAFNRLKYELGQMEIARAEKTAGDIAEYGRPWTESAKVHTVILENESSDYIKNLCRLLSDCDEGKIFMLFNKSADKTTWALVQAGESDFNFNAFSSDFLKPLGVKGGGKSPIWQGILTQPEKLPELMERIS